MSVKYGKKLLGKVQRAPSAAQALVLDYAATGVPDTEARLSRLAAWVLVADHSGQGFGLRLPGQELPLASGESQRRSALEALALWSPARA